jgi:hypothetical protein
VLSESRRIPIALPLAEAPSRARTAVVTPVVPEVPELLAAAERVLLTCAEVERATLDRSVAVAATIDPTLTPPLAVVGAGLPRSLADRAALRALRRVALALHPRVPGETAGWWTPDGRERLVEFRAAVVDARDLPLLADAAAQLTHPRRSREGMLGQVREQLVGDADEPPGDRHPDALGCLLASVLPVDDADTVALQRVAREVRRGAAGPVVLDERAHAAHRALTARVLGRL